MIYKELLRAVRLLRSLPKTIYFNFHYLNFSQAIKLPIWVSHRVAFGCLGGRVEIGECRSGIVQIGFDRTGMFDENVQSVWHISGCIKFLGKARIGPAMKLKVSGELFLGKNFRAGNNMSIYCSEHIRFGSDCLLSWDVLLMDNDFHEIRDFSGQVINQSRPIIFGDNVWIGCRSTVIKGAGSADSCVIAAGTLLNKRLGFCNSIIGGRPLKVLKENIVWNT